MIFLIWNTNTFYAFDNAVPNCFRNVVSDLKYPMKAVLRQIMITTFNFISHLNNKLPRLLHSRRDARFSLF